MSCRTCKDIGWLEASRDDLRPCPDCNHVHGATKAEVLCLAIGFGVLFFMLIVGAK